MPAALHRRATSDDWELWRSTRTSPQVLEDVTALAHRGSCAERVYGLRCTCHLAEGATAAGHRRYLLLPPPGLGTIPVLVPDPSGRIDPWHVALVELASRFHGPGTFPKSRFAGQGEPSVADVRTLLGHLDVLAGAFAGPGRADRMVGLARIGWDGPLPDSEGWALRERETGTPWRRGELLDELRAAVRR